LRGHLRAVCFLINQQEQKLFIIFILKQRGTVKGIGVGKIPWNGNAEFSGNCYRVKIYGIRTEKKDKRKKGNKNEKAKKQNEFSHILNYKNANGTVYLRFRRSY
jgi:hypothetical protein